MNIIYLCPETIYPANSGGRILVYNRVKQFTELGHNVYLFVISDSNKEIVIQNSEIKRITKGIYSYNRKSNCNKILNVFKTIFLPYAVASRTIFKIAKDMLELVNTVRIDIIIVELPQMALNITKQIISKKIPTILCFQNIEFLTIQNIGKTFTSPIKKFIYYIDSKKMQFYENFLYKANMFNAYVFITQEDENYFKTHLNYRNVLTFLSQTGSEDSGEIFKIPHTGKNILFVGKMSYQPNIDGVLWFYNKVWPVIKDKIQNIKLYIVGKDPSDSICKIKDPSVVITGTVDSVDEYYSIADVAIIPIFSGGGVKTKLIEAASHKIPVVCTKEGARGSSFIKDTHIFVANSAEKFGENIVRALNYDESIRNMVEKSYQLFKENYTWRGVSTQLLEFIKNLL